MTTIRILSLHNMVRDEVDKEGLDMYLRVTYHMLTMMSHDYSETLLNGYPSVDTVHLKTLPL